MKPEDDFYEIELGPEISEGVRVGARRRGDEVQLVSLTTMKDGLTLTPGSEIVDIEERNGRFTAKTVYKVPLAGGDGPPQVATPEYREGWGRVYGKKEVGLA